MAFHPDIVPSSATGQLLQSAIHKQLVFHGWSTDDDPVMAEYCLVMLGNRKTAEQITSELKDLIGSDFEESFVTWLFKEVEAFYPDPSKQQKASSSVASSTVPATSVMDSVGDPSPSSSSSAAPIGVVSDSRTSRPAMGTRTGGRGGRADGRGGRGGPGGGLFGTAVSGVKRSADDSQGQPTSQRARYERPGGGQLEGVPLGPRRPNTPNTMPNKRNNEGGDPNGSKSIFDRVNQQAPANPIFTGLPNGFDPIAQTIEAVTRHGAHPSALAAFPFAAVANHPQAVFLNPQILAQAQAAAMAQAQAFAAMSGAWQQAGANGGRVGGPPGRNNRPGPPFNPGFNNAGFPNGPGPGQLPPRDVPPHMGPRQNRPQYQQHQPPQGSGPLSFPPPRFANGDGSANGAESKKPELPIPTKPVEEAICKHGVDCIKPTCPYSHPSPAATKESGLVLNSEPCEKQLDCADPDCPKSHVSAAIKRKPSGIEKETTLAESSSSVKVDAPQSSVPPTSATTSIRPPAPPTTTDPYAIPGAGEKPCKFAGACTRKGCVFLHPWDVRGDASNAGGKIPCHWGLACTRADCHFGHPPGRQNHGSGGGFGGGFNKAKYSAVFNKPGSPSTTNDSNGVEAGLGTTTEKVQNDTGKIGGWPKEQSNHVSERLKRFNINNGLDEPTEKIIPGQQQQNQPSTKQKTNGEAQDENNHSLSDSAKVEINLIDGSPPPLVTTAI